MARRDRELALSLSTRAVSRPRLYAVDGEHRAELHHRIGNRQESAYDERANEIASELAQHFEHGRDFSRALRYREQAARNALRPQRATQSDRRLLRFTEGFVTPELKTAKSRLDEL